MSIPFGRIFTTGHFFGLVGSVGLIVAVVSAMQSTSTMGDIQENTALLGVGLERLNAQSAASLTLIADIQTTIGGMQENTALLGVGLERLGVGLERSNEQSAASLTLIADIQTTISGLQENTTLLEEKLERSGVVADTSLILVKITSVPWDVYTLQAQQEASYFHQSAFPVMLNADGTYSLTPSGEELLGPELRDILVRILERSADIKETVLAVGIPELVRESGLKDVPPGVLIGTVITFLQGR